MSQVKQPGFARPIPSHLHADVTWHYTGIDGDGNNFDPSDEPCMWEVTEGTVEDAAEDAAESGRNEGDPNIYIATYTLSKVHRVKKVLVQTQIEEI